MEPFLVIVLACGLPILAIFALLLIGAWRDSQIPTGIHQLEQLIGAYESGRGARINPGWYGAEEYDPAKLVKAVQEWRQEVNDYNREQSRKQAKRQRAIDRHMADERRNHPTGSVARNGGRDR